MAKRRRLSPEPSALQGSETSTEPRGIGLRDPLRRPPIAQVAGDSAATAALQDLADRMGQAERDGRLLLRLPLEAVVADHLRRDRLDLDRGALDELKQSLKARGQQMPVEVAPLPSSAADAVPRYGLISGWRRLTALRELAAEAAERDTAEAPTVLAVIRQPRDRADSYVAMVEENEIRADLSHFERARIVLAAVSDGAFETEKEALQSLFSSASYPRRSKIKSFIPVVAELGGSLRFPARLNERLGLSVSKALAADSAAAGRLAAALQAAGPETPEAEAEVLRRALKPTAPPAAPARPAAGGGVVLRVERGRVVLSGDGVDPDFVGRLRKWLEDDAGPAV